MSKNTTYNISFFLNYIRTPGKNPLEIVTDDEMRRAFVPFLINRFFSFSRNKQVQFTTQLLNRYTFSFYHQPEINFGLMYLLIPKSKRFEKFEYVKVAREKLQKYDNEVYNVFRKYMNAEYLTLEEINEYIDYLLKYDKQFLIKIFLQSGYTRKEIKKFLPMLSNELKSMNEQKLSKRDIKKILKELNITTQVVSNVSETKSEQLTEELL